MVAAVHDELRPKEVHTTARVCQRRQGGVRSQVHYKVLILGKLVELKTPGLFTPEYRFFSHNSSQSVLVDIASISLHRIPQVKQHSYEHSRTIRRYRTIIISILPICIW